MRSLTMRLALVVACACALLAPAAASATSSEEEIETSVGAGVAYMEGQQKEDGSFAGFGGDWSLTAFAAAGVAAANLKKTAESTDARTWYRNEVGAVGWPGTENPPVTDFERATLISYAAGIDPARVSKRQNLLAKVVAQYQPEDPGYYGETFNGTVFALLAMAGAKTADEAQHARFPQVVLDEIVEAIEDNQHEDGGWTWEKAAGNPEALEKPSEPDMTGAAMAALCEAGLDGGDPPIEEAVAYSESLLEENGALDYQWGDNTDSNAWVVQGLNVCGIDPQGAGFTYESEAEATPIDFLISQQLEGGGFRYLTSGESPSFYSSQDAVRALAGAGFTADPPVPTGELPQWEGETQFGTGGTETAPLALIIDDGVSDLEICSVTFAPKAKTTELDNVLDAAEKASSPSGCVSSYLPGGGGAAISQINGYPETPETKWTISIDGAEPEQAKRHTDIELGDTIYLKFE